MKFSAKLNLTQLSIDNHIIITKKGDAKSPQEGFLFFSGNKVKNVAEKLQKIAELLDEDDRISIEYGNSIPYLYDIVFCIRGENINDWNRKAEFINGYFVYDVDEIGKLIAANPTALQLFVSVLGQIEFKKFDVLKQERNEILSIRKKSEDFLFNESDLCLGINSYNRFNEFHFSVISPKSVYHFMESGEFHKLFEIFKVLTNYYRFMILLEKKKKAIKFSVMIITGEQTLNQQILRNDLIRKNISINRDLSFVGLGVYDLLNIFARLPCEQSRYSFDLQMKEMYKIKGLYESFFTSEFENYLFNAQMEFNSKSSFNLSNKKGTNDLKLNFDMNSSKKEWDKEYEKLSIPPVPEVPKKNVNIQWNTTVEAVKIQPYSKQVSPPKNPPKSNQNQFDHEISALSKVTCDLSIPAEEYTLFDEDIIIPEPNINSQSQSTQGYVSLAAETRKMGQSSENGFMMLKEDLMSKFKDQGITLSFQSDYILILPELHSLFVFVSDDTVFMLKKELIKSLLRFKISLFIQDSCNTFTKSCIEAIKTKKIPSLTIMDFSKANVINAIESMVKERRSDISSKAEDKKKTTVGMRSENQLIMNKSVVFNE